jgi:hypothetical protein
MKNLSRDEMKKVIGGRLMVCTCGKETVVCSYSSLASVVSCSATALNYCQSTGNGSAACDY